MPLRQRRPNEDAIELLRVSRVNISKCERRRRGIGLQQRDPCAARQIRRNLQRVIRPDLAGHRQAELAIRIGGSGKVWLRQRIYDDVEAVRGAQIGCAVVCDHNLNRVGRAGRADLRTPGKCAGCRGN